MRINKKSAIYLACVAISIPVTAVVTITSFYPSLCGLSNPISSQTEFAIKIISCMGGLCSLAVIVTSLIDACDTQRVENKISEVGAYHSLQCVKFVASSSPQYVEFIAHNSLQYTEIVARSSPQCVEIIARNLPTQCSEVDQQISSYSKAVEVDKPSSYSDVVKISQSKCDSKTC